MTTHIKRKIFNLYADVSLMTKLYIRLRWSVFNKFEDLEKYVIQSGKILDLGCGYGIFANLLALKSGEREIIGIDRSQKRIEIARMTQKGTSRKIKFVLGDIADFEFEKYSAIALIDTICYLPFNSQAKLLKECFSSLAKDGLFLIKDFNRHPFWKYSLFYLQEVLVILAKISFGNQTWRDIFRGRLYVRKSVEMMSLLREAGFTVQGIPFDKRNYQSHFLYVCHK